ncbi:MAG: hypothetical protein ACLS8R_08630 [Anaeromassilibacillus sp.]
MRRNDRYRICRGYCHGFSFTLRNDPTIRLRSQVTIEEEGRVVVAEDVENLAENEKVSVTTPARIFPTRWSDRQGYPRGDALSDRHPDGRTLRPPARTP